MSLVEEEVGSDHMIITQVGSKFTERVSTLIISYRLFSFYLLSFESKRNDSTFSRRNESRKDETRQNEANYSTYYQRVGRVSM